MSKGTKSSEQSTWWWNRKGFSWGVQTLLNHVKEHLPPGEADKLQKWIHGDLKAWTEAPEGEPLSPDHDAPPFPE